MYQGEIVEMGETIEVLKHPSKEYTRHLMNSVLSVTGEKDEGKSFFV